MSAESPTALLLRAADRLDELVGAATKGPWADQDPNSRWGDAYDHLLVGGGKLLGHLVNEHNGPFNATYIAAVDPRVGADFAAMLRAAAGVARGMPEMDGIGIVSYAMVAARKILGEEG